METVATRGRWRLSVAERFWAKVMVDPSGCWLWIAKTTEGYGSFKIAGEMIYAHRWIYEHLIGPIAKHLEIDHVCRNRSCVRPSHLEAVSHRVNVLRGAGLTARLAAQTHCKRGHEFSPQNTRIYRNRTRRYRICRICKHAADVAYATRRYSLAKLRQEAN